MSENREKYLINIAVGPVQEFIASARKLRDLWYGSYLLSELSKTVARTLHQHGCELIFPAFSDEKELNADSSFNVANKILAISPPGAEPEVLVAESREEFKKRWQEICEKAGKRAGRNTINQKLYDLQIDDFGEFFAAWTPLADEDKKGYQHSLHRCEQLLAGRKSLREFTAPAWDGAGLPKSSLDGIRESVINGAGGSKKQKTDSRAFQIKEGEELDVLGVVKRFGPWSHPDRPHFDNLAEVAAESFICGLKEDAKENRRVAELISKLPAGNRLYPDTTLRPPVTRTTWDGWPQEPETGLSTEILHPAVLEAELKAERKLHDTDSQSGIWRDLEKTLQSLWKETAQPSPYAALLVGDGDRMGETLKNLSTAKAHKQFSRELNIFAGDVHEVVEKSSGKVVYSGGDDIMAYLPLHTVLDCAVAINDFFRETMVRACAGNDKDKDIKIPTFSMGIVIIHMREPLHNALALVRQAETTAKEKGRNRLVIIQSKRSGSDLVINGSWQQTGRLASLPKRLAAFADAYSKNLLSNRLGYQLRAIGKECGDELKWQVTRKQLQPASPASPATAETLRLICRKEQGDTTISKEEAALLLADQNSIRHLSDELVIARQLSQSRDLSRASWNRKGEKNND